MQIIAELACYEYLKLKNRNPALNRKLQHLVSLVSGLTLPFSFAPFNFSAIAILAPALLLFVWRHATPKHAFQNGLLFGLGCFSIGISWVYISIHHFGGASLPISILITGVFIVYLSLFSGLQGYFFTKLANKKSLYALFLLFPGSWVASEALRGWLFTGFPWLFLGYSQTHTWLRGYAPLFGIYGVSFITALESALIFLIFSRSYSHKTSRLAALAFTSIFVAGCLLTKINWTQTLGKPVQVTLVQGNIEQEIKWLPDQFQKTLQLYSDYTQRHLESDLIIWPEAAITLPLKASESLLEPIAKAAKAHQATVITGIPVVEPDVAYNSMIALGNGEGIYHKRHLVPFGEYTPLKLIYSFIMQAFDIPMSNFSRGEKRQKPLMAGTIPIGPYICYEVAYPIEFLSFLPNAQLLITLTDDSWFGKSIASWQHLQMAQMRAIETGRYLLFAGNTGITAVINEKGQIIASLPTFQEGSLTAKVTLKSGNTPWIIWKNYPLFLLFTLTVVLPIKKRFIATSVQRCC